MRSRWGIMGIICARGLAFVHLLFDGREEVPKKHLLAQENFRGARVPATGQNMDSASAEAAAKRKTFMTTWMRALRGAWRPSLPW